MGKSKISKSWTTVTPLSKTIALILFIALPFIGFYLGYNYQKNPSSTVSLKKSDFDTTQWQEFSSIKYEFSINYPKNWKITVPTPSGNFEDSGALNFNEGYGGVNMSLEILPKSGTTLKLQEDSVRNYSWENKREDTIMVNGTKALQITGFESGKEQSVVLFAKDDYVYKFQSVLLNDLETFDKIISTLNFKN